MVCFTCQHCGSALHKNKVDKHYEFQCRKEPFLTCIDCLKDFSWRPENGIVPKKVLGLYGGQEYVEHTQCVTENERYGGKDYVHKESSGVKKRATWLSSVEFTTNLPGLSKAQTDLIRSILGCPNIPQKKKKFQNFVKSTFGRNCPHIEIVDSVFDLLDKTHKSNLEQEKEARKISTNELNGESERNKCSEGSRNVDDQMKNDEPSRKRKQTEAECENGEKCEPKKAVDEFVGKTKKRKNSYSNVSEENGNEELDCNVQLNESEDALPVNGSASAVATGNSVDQPEKVLSKKERKKKRKREKYEAVLNEIENCNKDYIGNDDGSNSIDDGENCTKKKKKKKDRLVNVNGDNTNEPVLNVNNIKNKQSCAEEEEPVAKKSKAQVTNVADNEEVSSCTTFKWDELIVRILESRSSQELSLNRLAKKLINEYQAVFGENHLSSEKLMVKFNKKIHRTPGVKVLKDKAILVKC